MSNEMQTSGGFFQPMVFPAVAGIGNEAGNAGVEKYSSDDQKRSDRLAVSKEGLQLGTSAFTDLHHCPFITFMVILPFLEGAKDNFWC